MIPNNYQSVWFNHPSPLAPELAVVARRSKLLQCFFRRDPAPFVDTCVRETVPTCYLLLFEHLLVVVGSFLP
jgi:hypothetical protein